MLYGIGIDFVWILLYNNTMTTANTFYIDNPLPIPVLSISELPASNITLHDGTSEILKITENGFYVRGEKVPADENEAAAVYKAFKEFLVYHALTRN